MSRLGLDDLFPVLLRLVGLRQRYERRRVRGLEIGWLLQVTERVFEPFTLPQRFAVAIDDAGALRSLELIGEALDDVGVELDRAFGRPVLERDVGDAFERFQIVGSDA
jgi:hypothetical protein